MTRRPVARPALLLAPLLLVEGCSYTPAQVACMHARDRAQHRGSVVGFGVAVLLVTGVVFVYVATHRSPPRRAWRAWLAVAVTTASVLPIGALLAFVGSWWQGRDFHCGDSFDMHMTGGPVSVFLTYLFFVAIPCLLPTAMSAAMLLWAKNLWHGGAGRNRNHGQNAPRGAHSGL